MRDVYIVKVSVFFFLNVNFLFFLEKWRIIYLLVVLIVCLVRKCVLLNVVVLILDFMFLMIKMF